MSGFAILVAMTMLAQHPVRQCAVSQQLDRAVEVPFQPFGVDACGRVIVQCFVHAGDVLYLLQHRPDVMADEDDGAVAVDLRQQLVEAGFEALVDVGARLVENKQLRVADDGSSQQARCSCPPLSCPMARCSSPSSPMRWITCRAFSR